MIRPQTHSVEGAIDGVPFCNYFKRLDKAVQCVKQHPDAVLYDLVTLEGQRWDPRQGLLVMVTPAFSNQTKETQT